MYKITDLFHATIQLIKQQFTLAKSHLRICCPSSIASGSLPEEFGKVENQLWLLNIVDEWPAMEKWTELGLIEDNDENGMVVRRP